MIDTQSGIALPAVPPIMPESINPLFRIQFSDGVRPALTNEPGVGLVTHFHPESKSLLGVC